MDETAIIDVPIRISNSLIGRQVIVKNRKDRPGSHEFLLGDQADLGVM